MSTTIDSLDIQIRSSAGSAAANIDRLAEALKRLRQNAKLTAVSNNLTRLSTSLGMFQNSSAAISNLRALADAMRGLANIPKATNLASVLNTLRRIPEIMSSLNASLLTQLASRMRQLAAALAPLATQLERVGTAFSRLPARIRDIIAGTSRLTRTVRETNHELDAQNINLAAAIANMQTYLSVLNYVRDAIVAVISDAIEWDGIQFRFGRAFGEDADMVLDYAEKVSDILKINQQQFMQYSSLYGSLLSGFDMSQDKVTTISIGLTELSYDIWAAYNDRYKTIEEASEAVRSAITGEIEPIRNAGIALTEASMQEYLDSIGLAHIRMANLSEAQKAQVRYAVMVNSAMNQGIVGTYASEMTTAEGAVRTLSQMLKSLGQAIGSLFIPILSAVIPWISAFVSVLYDAVAAVAAFFSLPFFKISWGNPTKGLSSGLADVADSAGTAQKALGGAGGAAKKLKDYTMGFDELNIIDPDTGSGGGGGGGGGAAAGESDWEGLDLETLWDESVFGKAATQVDELKQKILDWFAKWKTEIAIISGALATLSVANMLSSLGEALHLGEKFLSTMQMIKKLAATAIVITLEFALIKASFEDFMSDSGSFWDYIKALLIGGAASWVLYSMWGPTGLVIGFGVMAVASISAIFENGGIDSGEGVLVLLTGIASAAGAVALAWKKVVPALMATGFGTFVNLLRDGHGISEVLAATFPKLANAVAKVSEWFGRVLPVVRGFFASLSAGTIGIVVGIIAAIASVVYFLYENWQKVVAAVKEFFGQNIAPKLEKMAESWKKIKDILAEYFEQIKVKMATVKAIVVTIQKWLKETKALEKAWKVIKKVFEVVGGIIFTIISTVIMGAISAIVNAIENLVQIFTGVIEIFSGFIDLVVAIFSGGDIKAAAKKIVDGVVDVFAGLWGLVVGSIVEFFKGVIEWFTALWDELVGHSIVPDTINAIVEWFLSLPGKIFGAIEAFVAGIIERFKKMWNDIKDWWSSKVAPKFTEEYWKGVFETIRSAISTKLNEVKKKAAEKWAEIKEWFNLNVAPKFTVSYWKGVFETVREGLSEKLSEVKKAAQDKWDEIRNWYNTNIAPKFTKAYWAEKFSGLKDGLAEAVRAGINAAVAKINSFISWLNSHLRITLPSVTIGGKNVFAGADFQIVSIPTIPAFKQGGFIEDGLFTMNSGEIAGKFTNGKSVVANNQMIVEGIAAGVYSAVVAAMNDANSSGGQNINVFLDGKQIYASVKKTEAERGVSLMGNQLGYSY